MTSSIGSIPASSSAQKSGVEPVVLAGGPGQVPGVHEHVGGVELVDRAVQRHLADVPVGQDQVGGRRVVEQRLHGVDVRLPGADRVVVDASVRPAAACR